MPLSEYEQSVLDAMERALAKDDPKLTATFRDPGRRYRPWGRYVVAAGAVVVGLSLVLLGVVTELVVLGVLGFGLMFGVVVWALTSTPRSAASKRSEAPVTTPSSSKRTFMDRMEQRWDQREQRR